MDHPKYIREHLIPKIIENGRFSRDFPRDEEDLNKIIAEDVQVRPVGGFKEDYFASNTFTVDVTLRRNNLTNTINLVAKFFLPTEDFRAFALVDEMANNESRMYRDILPFFDQLWMERLGDTASVNAYPRCYWAQLTDPVVYVLENLQSLGFRKTEERAFLDKRHTLVAIKKLAVFHGLSYAAKALYPKKFRSLACSLRETRYIPAREEAQRAFLTGTVGRGLEQIENGPLSSNDKNILRQIKERLSDPYRIMYESANSARSPDVEDLAVVAHGDFLRNNLMFRYDENGIPVDVRFFDFQFCRYTTPAFDLSLYLFMNTTTELRKECWHEIFTSYHETLTSTVQQLVPSSNAAVPSLEAIKKDFARNALSGYCRAVFFLPLMAGPANARLIRSTDETKSKEDLIAFFANFGGTEATMKLADLIRDIIDYNLL